MSGEQLSLGLDLPAPAPPPAPPPPRPAPARPAPVPAAPNPQSEIRNPQSSKPFNYTEAMAEVVRDVVATLPELAHVDLDRVLLSIAQARQASQHGVYASCVPLRFEGGALESQIGRRRYRMPALKHQGREMLYVIYFMLPRFHTEQDYHGKLATIIHELYHISPQFDGDIRRFAGKNFAHGHSRERYHAAMCRLADRYLATSPKARAFEFLTTPFAELLERPGGVVGTCVRRPKAALVETPPAKPRKR
jgi:hypothetical protein